MSPSSPGAMRPSSRCAARSARKSNPRARRAAYATASARSAAADAMREAAPRREARAWPRLVVPALAAAMALGVGLDRLWLSSSEPDPRLDSLVAAFRRGQIADQPVDVAASDRHVVKPWLARKLPVSTLVVDLASEGFPLVGARIDIVAGQPAPTLVYRRREHQIALTELPLGAVLECAWRAARLLVGSLERRRPQLCRGLRRVAVRACALRGAYPQVGGRREKRGKGRALSRVAERGPMLRKALQAEQISDRIAPSNVMRYIYA